LSKEWSGERHGTIRFNDKSAILHGDTIVRDDEPICIIIRLNKYANEMIATNLNGSYYDTYLCTEELEK
jgi:hypothetical protein